MIRRAFSLVELLVVIGIIGILLALLLPTLRKTRLAAEQTVCASNLRQIGLAIQNYMTDNSGRLPFTVEPLYTSTGAIDLTADPFDASHPQSLANVLRPYVKTTAIYHCPSAFLGYPNSVSGMNYRVSSANNYDGQIRTEDQLFSSTGAVQYAYSLKYLNGRRYRLAYVNASFFPFRLARGVGPFYLVRDLVGRGASGTFTPPHRQAFNQLALDFSVSYEKNNNIGLTYP